MSDTRIDLAMCPGPPGVANAERVIVVMGDIEMGTGGPQDDFPHSAFLGDILLDYTRGAWAQRRVDIVFNGDTFDFLKVSVDGSWPHHITKEVALRKLEAILQAHRPFVEAIDQFITAGNGRNKVHFIVGNHDNELLFTAVQRELRAACGGHSQVRFPGFELAIGPVHIEHGHQYDPLFHIDPGQPFIKADQEPLLNLSWASIGLLSVVMPLHPELYLYDRLRPRRVLMELVPELKELFKELAWRYWTKDFWRSYLLKKDPLLKFNWTMLKEVVKGIVLSNPEVVIDRDWLKNTVEQRSQSLFVTGHLHHIGHHWHGAKRIVQAGAMRDEFMILKGGGAFEPLMKSYVEILLSDDRVFSLTMREVMGPPRPPGSQLESIYDLIPIVQAQLAALGEQAEDGSAGEEDEKGF